MSREIVGMLYRKFPILIFRRQFMSHRHKAAFGVRMPAMTGTKDKELLRVH